MSDNISEGTSPDKPKKRPNDKVRRIKNWEQVEGLYLEIDSPTFKQACESLGVDPKQECR